jgi:hypothetical protein
MFNMRFSFAGATNLKKLKTKLQRGAAQAERGELLDTEEVFQELRQLIAERKRAKGTATRVKQLLRLAVVPSRDSSATEPRP